MILGYRRSGLPARVREMVTVGGHVGSSVGSILLAVFRPLHVYQHSVDQQYPSIILTCSHSPRGPLLRRLDRHCRYRPFARRIQPV